MSSVLDALSEEQQEVIRETVGYHRLKRELVRDALLGEVRNRLIRQIAVATPAAGAEWSVSVPAGVTWDVISVSHKLVTSAVVATRASRVVISDQDNANTQIMPPALTQAASITLFYLFDRGYGAGVAVGAANSGAPVTDAPIRAGYSIASLTANIDAGDQYSKIVLTVREWSPLRVVSTVENLLADLDSAGGIPYSSIV